MPGFVESIGTINSALRTLIALGVIGVVTVGGWIGYREYNAADLALKEKDQELEQKQQRIVALEKDLEIVKARAEKLATALRLMKVEERLAYVDVLDQSMVDGTTLTTVEFTEVNNEDKPITEPQEFKLRGKRVYVEGLIIRFDDEFVEIGDKERGKPLFAFESIYGDMQAPAEGFRLDKPGKRPAAYATTRQVTEFEQRIWDNFWDIVHDPKWRAQEKVRGGGIDAKGVEARVGKRYLFKMRASGEVSFDPVGEAPKKPAPTL